MTLSLTPDFEIPTEAQLPKLLEESVKLRLAGRADLALQMLGPILTVFPQSIGVVFEIAHCLRNLNKFSYSSIVFERVLEAGPHQGALRGIIENLFSESKWENSLSFIEQYQKHFDVDAYSAQRKAKALRLLDKSEEAFLYLSKFEEQFSNSQEFIEELSLLNELQNASSVPEPTVESPAKQDLQTLREAIDKARGQTVAAYVAAMDRYLEINPKEPHLQFRRSVTLRENNQAAIAAQHLEALKEKMEFPIFLKSEYAHTLSAQGRFEEALKAFDGVLEEDPAYMSAIGGQVQVFIQLKRLQEAVELADAGLKRDEKNINLLFKAAQALRQMQRYPEALEYLRRIDAIDSNLFYVWHEASVTHRLAGNFEASIAASDRALALNPKFRWGAVGKMETLSYFLKPKEMIEFLEESKALKDSEDRLERQIYVDLAMRAVVEAPHDLARQIVVDVAPILPELETGLSFANLWYASELAQAEGVIEPYAAALKRAMADKTLNVWDGVRVIRILLSSRAQDLSGAVEILAAAMPPKQAAHFRLEAGFWMGEAETALRTRLRNSDVKEPGYIECTARLLAQVGKVAVAARYMQIAARQTPASASLFKHLIFTLIKAGEGDLAKKHLTEKETREFLKNQQWLLTLGECWLNLDDERKAKLYADRVLKLGGVVKDFQWYLSVLGRQGRYSEVLELSPALNEEAKKPHFGPSLEGTIKLETYLSTLDETVSYRTTPLAVTRLNYWTRQGGPVEADLPAEAPKLLQYWDRAPIPQPVQDIMKSWDAEFSDRRTLFDRPRARLFLKESFGTEWVRAFDNASSPAEESDFIRLAYLAQNGGLYADADDWQVGSWKDAPLYDGKSLIVFREPSGVVGNNILSAPPKHPAIVWAAISAKNALLRRDNDSTWTKTGPALLTRALAWYLERCAQRGEPVLLRIYPRWKLGKSVAYHTQLPYKSTPLYWNAATVGHKHKAVLDRLFSD